MPEFEEVELMFKSLLSESKLVLSDLECAEIQEYIDVGEYGIALKTAVSIYVEENKVASDEVKVLVSRLAKEMLIEPDSLLSRFQ